MSDTTSNSTSAASSFNVGSFNAHRTDAEYLSREVAGIARRLAKFLSNTPIMRDAAMAAIYTSRADEQKHDFERQQDLAERAADRRTQVLSSFVLGASFGAFLFF